MNLLSRLFSLFRRAPIEAPAPALVWTHTVASSFADLQDVAGFKKCKAGGGSDVACFAKGDNGKGCWGDITAQGAIPMCALPPEEIRRHCGSMKAKDARNRRVLVLLNERKVECRLADRMPEKANRHNGAGIDLNPAALVVLGLKAPIMLPCSWAWLD
jgi:hypothetical protein